jgi:hypothetical protein
MPHRHKKKLVVVSTCTTTDRRFRQLLPNILWFEYEFFLTTFLQPLILRTQTRGNVNRFFADRAAGERRKQTGFYRKSEGNRPQTTPRLDFQRGLAGLFSFFRHETCKIWFLQRLQSRIAARVFHSFEDSSVYNKGSGRLRLGVK